MVAGQYLKVASQLQTQRLPLLVVYQDSVQLVQRYMRDQSQVLVMGDVHLVCQRLWIGQAQGQYHTLHRLLLLLQLQVGITGLNFVWFGSW